MNSSLRGNRAKFMRYWLSGYNQNFSYCVLSRFQYETTGSVVLYFGNKLHPHLKRLLFLKTWWEVGCLILCDTRQVLRSESCCEDSDNKKDDNSSSCSSHPSIHESVHRYACPSVSNHPSGPRDEQHGIVGYSLSSSFLHHHQSESRAEGEHTCMNTCTLSVSHSQALITQSIRSVHGLCVSDLSWCPPSSC